MTIDDKKYMQAAIDQGQVAKNVGDLPFGTVIVCSNKIVGRGECRSLSGDVTEHAEIIAIREACKKIGRNNLSDCIIYCTNEPCVMCSATIFQAKIADVKFGLNRDDLSIFLRKRKISIEDLAKDSGYKIKITKGIMRSEILKQFDGAVRKDDCFKKV
jgi:tRNA(Arg) A34 adenosine deaminase TadA